MFQLRSSIWFAQQALIATRQAANQAEEILILMWEVLDERDDAAERSAP